VTGGENPVNTFRYILGVLLVVGLPPGMAWWFVVHPFVGFWRKVGVRGTMIVMFLFFAVSVVGLAMIRDTLLGPDLGLHWPLVALGAVLAAAAIFIGIKRKRYLTMRILAGVPEVETEVGKRGKLLAEGPYALIRPPSPTTWGAGLWPSSRFRCFTSWCSWKSASSWTVSATSIGTTPHGCRDTSP
jgi:protein-S-isoprenylcysteine O-methyltransferase Ste14